MDTQYMYAKARISLYEARFYLLNLKTLDSSGNDEFEIGQMDISGRK